MGLFLRFLKLCGLVGAVIKHDADDAIEYAKKSCEDVTRFWAEWPIFCLGWPAVLGPIWAMALFWQLKMC